jgi:hypothetical protein
MNSEKHIFEKTFLWKWVLYTIIALPAGLLLSFPAAWLVNLIYPKETNLVVGLCLGAAVGYFQWFALKRNIQVSSLWGLACSIGIGIPFIVSVILNETGIEVPEISDNNLISWLLTGIIGGFLSGLMQLPLLKPFFRKAGWWLVASTSGWGLSFLAFQVTGRAGLADSGAGALLLGLITGSAILLINKFQNK